ncbi:MAG: gamma-glutamyl-gamma-aminobutyrate hydrolase family protein, partial [Firmicutes bacterium]|nr:gamma-glutamyl-gamma-aminobutyrate hydrolase family protein [Bacillota bacterium]
HGVSVAVRWVRAEDLERDPPDRHLEDADGILVPGGFGDRGVEGKICAIRYARERNIPFLGICLGMQLAVVEFARGVLGWTSANSSEFAPDTPYPVIDLLPEQKRVTYLGGTMRLGAYPCRLVPGTRAHAAYGCDEISERHRHRYEVNNAYRDILGARGLVASGLSPDGQLVEVVELRDHPWFVATQFHPEFKSRPIRAHPLFREFVGRALARRRGRTGGGTEGPASSRP